MKTWSQKCSINFISPSQNPTRGRPQFSTSISRRSGSTGTFADFERKPSESRSSSARGRSASRHADHEDESRAKEKGKASGDDPQDNKRLGRRDSSVRLKDAEEAEKKKKKERPMWRGTSPSPGIPQREFSYSADLKGDKKKKSDDENGDDADKEEHSATPYHRSASARSESRQSHVPAALESNVAALLRRDLARKSKEQIAQDETEKRIKAAVGVRFSLVPKQMKYNTSAKRPSTTGGSSTTRPGSPSAQYKDPNQSVSSHATFSHTPMHPHPREGLRVSYYDKGRKMTTAELWGEERIQEHISPSPQRGGGAATGLNDSMSTTASRPVQYGIDRAAEIEDPDGHKLWIDLQDAEDAVKAIPKSFFDALRSLRSEPPRRVLLTMHLCVLLLEPHCQVVPLPRRAIWPAVKDALHPENLIQRLMNLQLDDVSLDRIAALKQMVVDEVQFQEKLAQGEEEAVEKMKKEKEEEADKERKKEVDGKEENQEDTKKQPETPTKESAPGEEEEEESPAVSPSSFNRDIPEEAVNPIYERVFGQKLRQLVDQQSPHAATLVQWVVSFFGAHDHIVRDKKAAVKPKSRQSTPAATAPAVPEPQD